MNNLTETFLDAIADIEKDVLPEHDNLPFLTGSQVYGTPTEKSDIDLVLYMEEEDMEKILKLAEQKIHPEYGTGEVSLYFGLLNLIICTDKLRFDIWKKGTLDLKKRAPVTREEAVEHFQFLREKNI